MIGLRLTILLKIANEVSKIGIARTTTGTTTAIIVDLLRGPTTDRIAIINPRNKAPPSPIKVFAGEKLKGKNPMQLPAIATMAIQTIGIPAIPP